MVQETALFKALVATQRTELNMREEPSTGALLIEKIPKGETVEVLELTNDDWWRVRYKGETGYAAKQYLNRVEDDERITISKSVAQALYDVLGVALGISNDSVD